MAASSTIKMITFLKDIGQQLQILNKDPVPLFCDNKGAVQIISNEASAQRTRRLGAQLAYAREQHQKGRIRVSHVPGKDQLADIFTKALPADRFKKLRAKLMLTTLLISLICCTLSPIHRFEFARINEVTWYETDYYVESGQILTALRLTMKNHCRTLKDTNSTGVLKELFDELANHCSSREKIALSSGLNRLERFQFGSNRKSPPVLRQAEEPSWVDGFLEGICFTCHASYQSYNADSTKNTTWTNRKQIINITSQLENFKKEMEKVYEINVNSIKNEVFLLENVNRSTIRLETLITKLPRILMAVNQINSLIEKDTEFLYSLETDFKRDLLDTTAVCKWLPEYRGLRDLDPSKTQMVKASSDKYQLKLWYIKPKEDTSSFIYRAVSFKKWIDSNNYLIYIGPTFLIHNTTSNCSKFIEHLESLKVINSCTDLNQTVAITKPLWKFTSVEKDNISAMAPSFYSTSHKRLMGCYQHRIKLGNQLLSCPKWPFSLPSNLSFSIRGTDYGISNTDLVLEETSTDRLITSEWLEFEPWKAISNSALHNLDHISKDNEELHALNHQFELIAWTRDHPIETISLSSFTVISVLTLFSTLIYCLCRQNPIERILETQIISSISENIAEKTRASRSETVASAPPVSIRINVSEREQPPVPVIYPILKKTKFDTPDTASQFSSLNGDHELPRMDPKPPRFNKLCQTTLSLPHLHKFDQRSWGDVRQ